MGYNIIIDRPIGYKDDFRNIYPINYGYISGIIAGDGEEQDVYILGIKEPLKEYKGKIIAKIIRKNDVEEKWVTSDVLLTPEQIYKQVEFIEKWFDSNVVCEVKTVESLKNQY